MVFKVFNMKIEFLLLLLILSFDIYAQNTYLPPYRSNVRKDLYEGGIKTLIKGRKDFASGEFKTLRDTTMYYYQTGITYANSYEPNDSIFYYIDKAILLDSFVVCRALIFRDSLVTANRMARPIFEVDSVKFKDYKEKCQVCVHAELERRAISKKKILLDTTINKELIGLLAEMFKKDQLYRVAIGKTSNKKAIDSLWNLQNIIDNKNQLLLDSIFKKVGYPGKKLVTEYYQSNAAMMLLHAPAVFQRKHLNLMVVSYKTEILDALSLMMLLDKIYIEETDKQLFGTQSYLDGRKSVYYTQEEGTYILKQLGIEELSKKLKTE